jgi:hypothetical protein
MNTEPAGNPDIPEATLPDRTFDNIVTALNRGEALLKMVGDFSTSALQKLEVLNISQLANPDILTAMDIYDRPLKDVTDLLKEKGIKFGKPKPVNPEEAHTLQNLGATIAKLPPNSSVELLTHQDRVIGIRVLGEKKP